MYSDTTQSQNVLLSHQYIMIFFTTCWMTLRCQIYCVLLQLSQIPAQTLNPWTDHSSNIVLSPEAGIALEDQGTILVQTGFSFIPLTLHLPSIRNVITQYELCDDANLFVTQLVELFEEHLDRFIPAGVGTFSHPARSVLYKSHAGNGRAKRFIPLLMGALSVGTTVWNRVSISSLQSKITILESYVKHNRQDIITIKKTILKLSEQQDEIIHAVNQLSVSMDQLQRTLNCSMLESGVFQGILFPYLLTGPSEFMRAIDGALMGKITPELLPSTDLYSTLLRHKDLKTSLYNDYPNLVYELGSFYLHRVDRSPPLLSGIMILPHLSRTKTSRLLTVSTVPMMMNQILFQYSLPSVIAVDPNNKIAWEISAVECVNTALFWVCPQHLIGTKVHQCVTNLVFKSNITGCPTRITKMSGSSFSPIMQLKSGVLVSNAVTDLKILKIISGREILSNQQESTISREQAQYITSSVGDYVVLGTEYYALSTNAEEYTVIPLALNITLPQIRVSENPTLLPEGQWKHLNDILIEQDLEDRTDTIKLIIYSTLGGLLLLGGILFSAWYLKLKISSSHPTDTQSENHPRSLREGQNIQQEELSLFSGMR